MRVDNEGIVVAPKKYNGWSAEMAGDTSDTGGIYLFLFSPDSAFKITYWEIDIQSLEAEIEKEGLVILWSDSYCLKTFL